MPAMKPEIANAMTRYFSGLIPRAAAYEGASRMVRSAIPRREPRIHQTASVAATTTASIVQKYACWDDVGDRNEKRPGTVGNPNVPPVRPPGSLTTMKRNTCANENVSSDV
jgi:hypothetical protein